MPQERLKKGKKPKKKMHFKIAPPKIKYRLGSSCRGAAEMNPTRNHEFVGLVLGLTQWVKDLALP